MSTLDPAARPDARERPLGRFPELLRARLPGARVLALDLPGNGRLNQATQPDAHRGDDGRPAGSSSRRSGVAPPYHLLAMSLGAMVAVDWAARHPDELAGCVLINTSLRPFSPLVPAAAARQLRRAARPAGSGRQTAAQREQTILRLTSRQPAAGRRRWSTTGRRCARRGPVSPANALRQLLAAARYRAPAQPPAVPLLVLASRARRAGGPALLAAAGAAVGRATSSEHPHGRPRPAAGRRPLARGAGGRWRPQPCA